MVFPVSQNVSMGYRKIMRKCIIFRLLVIAAVISVISGCAPRSNRSAQATLQPTAFVPAAINRAPYDPAFTQKQVEFYAAGAKRDPKGAIIRAMLAASYLQRCRETGDIADALRAEQTARSSLRIRRKHNDAANTILAQSLLMQHRFNEALTVAERPGAGGTTFNVTGLQTSTLVAEIHIERGDYTEASKELAALGAQRNTVTFEAIQARQMEMDGYPEQALALLRSAQADADADADMSRENVAWFHMRVGDLLAELGRIDEAECAYRGALELDPRHHLTLTALTRLNAGKGDWKSVILWGQKSANIVPNPEVLALLGDAYTALGDRKNAQSEYHLIEVIGVLGRAQGTVYDRQRALYLADHNRDLNEALNLAQRELKARHDVYAYDTLAWCYYKSGRMAEAAAAMAKANARGTKDARLFYHAGAIELAMGDKQRARTDLTRALATNACFSPFAPDRAREMLKSIN
jgi:tetratricopeptide (TPR) repeat protein